jgi:hypothetical protein
MTERTFTIALNDTDRCMILTALGYAGTYLIAHSAPIEQQRPINELIRRLSDAPGQDVQHAADPAASTPAAAPSRPAPVTFVDYFQRDRKGNFPSTAPDGATLQTVKVLQAKPIRAVGKAPRLEVLYQGGKANCFDELLWPRISKVGEAQLWIAESGNYLNVVGVRQ